MDTPERKPSKMQSFRLELENVAAIDKLARTQGISRSDWFRRAVLAQLVQDLVELKREAVRVTPPVMPVAPREEYEIPTEELGDRPPLPEVPRETPPSQLPPRIREGIGERANRWN